MKPMIATNTRAVFFGVTKALPLMATGGSILLTSSIASARYMENHVVYAGTKAAIEAFARNWSVELMHRRIRVNVINAGFGNKDLVTEATGSFPVPQRAVDAHDDVQGMVEGARTVLWLASDESSIVTGAVLCADRGFAAGMPLPGSR